MHGMVSIVQATQPLQPQQLFVFAFLSMFTKLNLSYIATVVLLVAASMMNTVQASVRSVFLHMLGLFVDGGIYRH